MPISHVKVPIHSHWRHHNEDQYSNSSFACLFWCSNRVMKEGCELPLLIHIVRLTFHFFENVPPLQHNSCIEPKSKPLFQKEALKTSRKFQRSASEKYTRNLDPEWSAWELQLLTNASMCALLLRVITCSKYWRSNSNTCAAHLGLQNTESCFIFPRSLRSRTKEANKQQENRVPHSTGT